MDVSRLDSSPGLFTIPDPEQVLKNPCCLNPHIKKTEGLQVFDSLKYPAHALDCRLRDRLISRSLQSKMSIRHTIPFFSFSKPALNVPENDCRELMGKAVHRNNPLHTKDKKLAWQLSGQSVDQDQQLVTQCPGSLYRLEAPLSTRDGQLMAIYNYDDGQVVTLKMGDQRLKLKAHSGLILKAQSDKTNQWQWQLVSKYTSSPKTMETNPLVDDVTAFGKEARVTGEMLLTPVMVRDLVRSETKPEICQSADEVLNCFHQLALMPLGAVGIIVFSEGTNHTVALRAKISGNNVFLYIHESLGPDNPVARGVRNDILQSAQKAFNRHNFHLVTPGFRLQSDFCSCSLFALDALNAFENNPELDQWLSGQCQNDQARVWEGKKGKRISPRGEPNRARATLPAGSHLDVRALPPELLRLSQNGRLHFLPEQLQAVVAVDPGSGKDLSLAEFFKLHTRPLALAGQEPKPVNLAATVMRYQQLLRWDQDHKRKSVSKLVDSPELAIGGASGGASKKGSLSGKVESAQKRRRSPPGDGMLPENKRLPPSRKTQVKTDAGQSVESGGHNDLKRQQIAAFDDSLNKLRHAVCTVPPENRYIKQATDTIRTLTSEILTKKKILASEARLKPNL